MTELFLLGSIPVFPRPTKNSLSCNTQASFVHLSPNISYDFLNLTQYFSLIYCISLVVTKDIGNRVFLHSPSLHECSVSTYIPPCQLRITHACFMSNANYQENVLLFLSAPVCSLPCHLSLFLSITLLNTNVMLLLPCFNCFSCHFVQILLSLKCLYVLWKSLLVFFMFSLILISRKQLKSNCVKYASCKLAHKKFHCSSSVSLQYCRISSLFYESFSFTYVIKKFLDPKCFLNT